MFTLLLRDVILYSTLVLHFYVLFASNHLGFRFFHGRWLADGTHLSLGLVDAVKPGFCLENCHLAEQALDVVILGFGAQLFQRLVQLVQVLLVLSRRTARLANSLRKLRLVGSTVPSNKLGVLGGAF